MSYIANVAFHWASGSYTAGSAVDVSGWTQAGVQHAIDRGLISWGSAAGVLATNLVTITSQSGTTYTLVLADAFTEIEGSNASATTFTIPPNSSVAFAVGTTLNIRQMGAGQITVAAGAGVTLRAPNGAKSSKQYATAGLIKRATDEWIISGDTAV